jgi:hypothetical protein
MTTRLEKTLRREVLIKDTAYIVALTPQGMKLTLKGHRKGVELTWEALISGEAALAMALNASVGLLEPATGRARKATSSEREPVPAARNVSPSAATAAPSARELIRPPKAGPVRKARRGKRATSGSRKRAR